MNKIEVKDIKQEVFNILEKHSGKYFNLMISGGSLLNVLDNIKYKELNCNKWNIYFADERVDQNNLNSTGAKKFLSYINNAKVFPIETSLFDCSKIYNKILQKVDVALLGIGENGHICSLWPNSDSLNSELRVIDVTVDNEIPKRVTTTIKYINSEIENLYFIIPYKNGKPKKVTEPHKSIKDLIKKEYTIIIEK